MGTCRSKKVKYERDSALIEKKPIINIDDVNPGRDQFIFVHNDMSLFLKKYDLYQDTLGKGISTTVKKAVLRHNKQPRAVKIINKIDLDEQSNSRLWQ